MRLRTFVVKTTEGSFNAVGGDMALEQTIQTSAKSAVGITGKTKCQDYVSEWAVGTYQPLNLSNIQQVPEHNQV